MLTFIKENGEPDTEREMQFEFSQTLVWDKENGVIMLTPHIENHVFNDMWDVYTYDHKMFRSVTYKDRKTALNFIEGRLERWNNNNV